MSDLDRMIEESLREADRDAPTMSREPGYFRQAIALFTGRLAWVHWTIMISQLIMFGLAIYCTVYFFQATETLEALRWGLPATVLFIMSGLWKTALGPEFATNRLLMEMKRLELRIEQLKAER